MEDHDLVPSLSDNPKSQTHSRVTECDGRPSVQVEPSPINRMVTASAGVQTDLAKWFTPHVDLFATRLNHKIPLYIFPVPDQKCLGHRCSKHKLVGSHCLCLPSHGSPSQGDPCQEMQLPVHCNNPRLARDALVFGPSAALNRDPTSVTSVKNSSHTVPQLCITKQSTTSQPPRLVSRSGRLPGRGFSVEVAENCFPSKVINKDHLQFKWALFEKWCRENSVDFSTPSVKQVSDFFMYLYQDLNFSCICTRS